jgi:hypothetical protein
MEYSPEQREIVRRLGDISARFYAMRAAHMNSQTTIANSLIDAVNGMQAAITALNVTIRQSIELAVIFQEYGDAWREFLDTL